MLPVGDPLKDSGNSEEGERKKPVRIFFPMYGHTRNKNADTNYYGK